MSTINPSYNAVAFQPKALTASSVGNDSPAHLLFGTLSYRDKIAIITEARNYVPPERLEETVDWVTAQYQKYGFPESGLDKPLKRLARGLSEVSRQTRSPQPARKSQETSKKGPFHSRDGQSFSTHQRQPTLSTRTRRLGLNARTTHTRQTKKEYERPVTPPPNAEGRYSTGMTGMPNVDPVTRRTVLELFHVKDQTLSKQSLQQKVNSVPPSRVNKLSFYSIGRIIDIVKKELALRNAPWRLKETPSGDVKLVRASES